MRKTSPLDVSRREVVLTGVGTAVYAVLSDTAVGAVVPAGEPAVSVSLKINGAKHSAAIDPRRTLLDFVRETAGLTGTKKGCDHGQCGACTVLVEGRRIVSCLTLAAMHDGDAITTIEGFGSVERLHPMQAAFIEHDGFQCGFCTSGQICSAIAVREEIASGIPSHVTDKLDEVAFSDAEVRERMSGNICRCAAYPNIVAAIRSVEENAG